MTFRRGIAPAAALFALAAAAPAAAQTVTICHATGGPGAAYQQIEVSAEASVEHLQHTDDIVPAPPEGCPAQVMADEVDPAYPLPTVTATPVPDAVPPPQRPRPRAKPRRRPAPRAQVQPEVASGNLGPTASVQAETLPLTGSDVPPIALMGLGFLLAGAGLRLRLGAAGR